MTAIAPTAFASLTLIAAVLGAPAQVTSLAEVGLTPKTAEPLASCDGVTLMVKNNKSVKIKALKVEYKSVEDGKWRTEKFADESIAAGTTEVVKTNAKLEHVEGHQMKSIRLHYKKWCGGKWSVTYTTTDSTFDSAKCVYGKEYRVDVPSGGC